MHSAHTFFVKPHLPEKLLPLEYLALNLNWHRQEETAALFRYLEPQLWEQGGQNPVLLLQRIGEERLQAAAEDIGYTGELNRVWQHYRKYENDFSIRAQQQGLDGSNAVIAYFSAEFGLAQSLPVYSGGLGILAGDHLKSASDLGIPLVGIGLLYRQGYFRQLMDLQGWQQEIYPHYDFYQLPLELQRQADGRALTVEVPCSDRNLKVQIWLARVGCINLYLLDTDCRENRETDRQITDRLYGGDLEKRIRQEIVLGIGGIRALETLGYKITICHLNEGHSAFLALEKIRYLTKKQGLDFAVAREQAGSGNIFTTHTPVAAGIDLFPLYLMDKYFTSYYQQLGLSRKEFLALGRKDPNNNLEPFNMAILALRLSSWVNGVSRLHGHTARRMWASIWPGVPEAELPISSITNGIHIPSWIGTPMAVLYDRYLGDSWRQDPSRADNWAGLEKMPERELWQAREEQRQQLLAFTRRRLANRLAARGAGQEEILATGKALIPGALTIGFARRFATYKRPALLFHNLERLARLLADPRRPLQVIYAGKAHPRDEEGKELIRQIMALAARKEFCSQLIFIEDYDINVARYLVQGVDIWLANPRRPLEASATSGMKAVINGALHVSTLDGWWAEAWTPAAGWAIGRGEVYDDPCYQDEIEAAALYNLLEKEIIPLFYQRDNYGLPVGWLAMMKNSIRSFAPVFNTQRMVAEYNRQLYLPAAELYQRLQADSYRRARELADWKRRVRTAWTQIRIEEVKDDRQGNLQAGESLAIRVRLDLGSLTPADVKAEIYHGAVDAGGEIAAAEKVIMTPCQDFGGGKYIYSGQIQPRQGGRWGYKLRVMPWHPDLSGHYLQGLVIWG